MIQLNFPNAIQEEKDFYGRKDELNHIVQVLQSEQRIPVVVLGERRIGKTSIQNVVLRCLQRSSKPHYKKIDIEPRSVNTLNEFVRAIFIRMCLFTGNSLEDTGLLDTGGQIHLDAIEQFESAFTRLTDSVSEEIYIICVDEFDEILRKVTPIDNLYGLIFHVVENTDLPIKFFFTVTGLPDHHDTIMSSPLTSICELVALNPFSEEEMNDMLKGIFNEELQWPQEHFEWLYNLSGGHPYIVKLLLANLDIRDPHTDVLSISQTMLDKSLQRALEDQRAEYAISNLYHAQFNNAEKELILLLTEREHSIQQRELKSVDASWVSTAKQLVKRHYLYEQQESFHFKIVFLKHWFVNWVLYLEERERFTTLRNHLAEPIEIEVDRKIGQVRVLNNPIKLSVQEFHIMQYLAEKKGGLVEREELVDIVWRAEGGVTDQVIDAAIYRLRKKLGDEGQYLETIPGQGVILHRAVLV